MTTSDERSRVASCVRRICIRSDDAKRCGETPEDTRIAEVEYKNGDFAYVDATADGFLTASRTALVSTDKLLPVPTEWVIGKEEPTGTWCRVYEGVLEFGIGAGLACWSRRRFIKPGESCQQIEETLARGNREAQRIMATVSGIHERNAFAAYRQAKTGAAQK